MSAEMNPGPDQIYLTLNRLTRVYGMTRWDPMAAQNQIDCVWQENWGIREMVPSYWNFPDALLHYRRLYDMFYFNLFFHSP
jgi:hypothetical protein